MHTNEMELKMKFTKYHLELAISFGIKDFSALNLRGTDLRGTDLYGTDLCLCSGNMKQVKSMQIDTYRVSYTSTHLSIGCWGYKIEEWASFSDKEIISMGGKSALKFWRKFKDFIFTAIELSPAE